MQEPSTRDEAPLVDEPWRSPLDELERTLSEVARALAMLRASLENGGAPSLTSVAPEEPAAEEPEPAVAEESTPSSFQAVWERIKRDRQQRGPGPNVADTTEQPEMSTPPVPAPEEPQIRGPDVRPEDTAQAVDESQLSSFEGVWDRLERERKERSEGDIKDIAELRGLEHLPQAYRITVEDRDGTPVDLVSIHRALLTFAPADSVSLVSFANGVPVVSLRTDGELDFERLAATIGAATSRHCEVIPQDQSKLFLRLSTEEGIEG